MDDWKLYAKKNDDDLESLISTVKIQLRYGGVIWSEKVNEGYI